MAAGDNRFTRFGVEAAGQRPAVRTHFTRIGVEVVGRIPTPKQELTRYGVELVGPRPFIKTHFSRYGVEVIGKIPAAKMEATRFAVEVIGRRPPVDTRFSRYGVEVVGRIRTPRMEATRFAIEVLGKFTNTRLTRYHAEVIGSPTRRTRWSRYALEVLGRWRPRMIPNPLPATLVSIFSHNWAATARLESAYLTDITSAGSSLAEERRGIVDRPYRTLTARFVGFNRGEVLRLSMLLARHSHDRSQPVPLFTDHSRVTADSSGTTLHCDTTNRRFFVNGRVVIHKWDKNNRPVSVEYAQILLVNPTNVVLTQALSQTFPAGSRVYPLIEAEINLEGSIQLPSDETADLELTIKEVVGRSALPPTTSGLPAGFQTYLSRPIFDVPLDWSANIRTGIFREGYKFISGRAEVVYLAGTRPQFEHEMRLTLLDRAKVWKVVQFFDSRMGRLRSFWMVDPASKFTARSLLTTQVRVEPQGNIQDLIDFMKYIAVVKRDGTVYVRGVSSVTLDTGDWVIAFDSAIPSTSLTDVRKVTPAYLVRLKDDFMLEEWSTDETCSISMTGIEILDDNDQELTGLTVVQAGPPPVGVADLYFWGQPARNTYANTGRSVVSMPGSEPDVVGSSLVLWDDARLTPSNINLEGSSAPGHIVYSDPETNNGRPTLQFTGAGKWHLRPLGDTFYDNTPGKGLTVFMAYRVGNSAGTWTHFLKKTGVLEWGPTVCKMFETLDGEVGANNITFSSLLGDDLSRNVVVVLTWSPGSYARVYKNGTLMGSASTPVTDLPAEATRELEVYSMASQFDANDVLIYKRALSSAQLNTVGQFLATMYDSPWSTIA